ncbi:MAG: hypothetical protein CUN52_07380 [Phototrophicales bacterium]|nr:MAG: hypothetical protein CUN52_07380 [Phototrophicales bacterium]
MKKWMIVIIGMLILLMCSSIASAQRGGLLAITYQRFERGYMVWRADNSHIWVFGDNGQVFNFPATVYQRYAENRITAPSGLRAPIMGFGKVWGNTQAIRDLLGYATTEEASANANYQQIAPSNVIFLAFANVTMQIDPDGRWVSNALSNTARVTNFTLSSYTPRANEQLTINWSSEGGDFVVLEVHETNSGRLLQATALSNSGATTIITPNTPSISITIWVVKNAQNATAYPRLAYQVQNVQVSNSTVTTPPPTGQCTLVGNVYTVQRGDTLSRIARRCGVTLDALATANGIVNRNRIFVGQRLIIP